MKLGFNHKGLMGHFNSLAARAEFDPHFVTTEIRFELTRLLARAETLNEPVSQGLCARYLSHILLDEKNLTSSIELARKAEKIFAEHGPVSDYLLESGPHRALPFFDGRHLELARSV